MKPVLLLGAGASIDAGIPGAFDLTESVYNHLLRSSPREAKLFGYIVAKLITKNARTGASPFSPINIEHAYDALKKFLSKESDVLSEFVYSWDDQPIDDRPEFDERTFTDALGGLFHVNQTSNVIRVSTDSFALRKMIKQLRLLGPSSDVSSLESRIDPFMNALTDCLASDGSVRSYIASLVDFARTHCDAIGTLNYDSLIEEACEAVSAPFDYGLSQWNESKFIKFHGMGMKIVKLHGSKNWQEREDDILVGEENTRFLKRGMIFGGQGEKLVPHGPYLQLRHEFQILLRKSNVLGIAGYSFQDVHLNAIIRSWVSTRKKAKLVILDPGEQGIFSRKIGRWFSLNKSRQVQSYHVELVHIKKGAEKGVSDFINELKLTPKMPDVDPRGRNSVRTLK